MITLIGIGIIGIVSIVGTIDILKQIQRIK
jgi:hypothetical protein